MNETIVEKSPQSANKIQVELMKLLTDIDSQEAKLDHDFVRLGVMLDDVRSGKLWQSWGYDGYDSFIKSLAEKCQKTGRTKLYNCARIAEQLLEVADAADVIDIGITKAGKLASAIKNAGGKKPSDALLQQAKKSPVKDFDAHIAAEYEFTSESEKGDWFNLSGICLTKEEREEFMRAVRVACQDDPPIQILDRWDDNQAAHLRREVLWRWYTSYLAEKEPEVAKKSSNGGDRSTDQEADTDI
jgi:hypothetical protein